MPGTRPRKALPTLVPSCLTPRLASRVADKRRYLPAASRLGPRSAGGLVTAVKDVGDVVDLVGVLGRIAAGGAQVRVPETGRHVVDGHAVVEQRRRPVGG